MTRNEVDHENALQLCLYESLTIRGIQQVHLVTEGEEDEDSSAKVLEHIQVEAGCEVEGGTLRSNEVVVHRTRVDCPRAAPVLCSSPEEHCSQSVMAI